MKKLVWIGAMAILLLSGSCKKVSPQDPSYTLRFSARAGNNGCLESCVIGLNGRIISKAWMDRSTASWDTLITASRMDTVSYTVYGLDSLKASLNYSGIDLNSANYYTGKLMEQTQPLFVVLK